MSYSAGNLELSILGFSDKAVASIDVTAKALRRLASSIDKINNTQFVLAGQKMEVLFTKIAQSTSSINTKNLDNLASAAKSLSAVSKIGNLDKVDYSKVAKGFSQLTVAITPFVAKVKEAEASLTALYGILNKGSSKKLGGLIGNNSSKKGLLSGLLYVGKLTAVLYVARKLGSVFANIANKGADFSETLNLWQVSMGQDFLPQATKFVDKLNEAYGISKETLMNSQAIFKNMLGSLGQISEQSAYALSEGITQMALDYASLYNVKFEDAMTKFQAALAGQVRPIRSVSGYDITENTLFQLYQQLGGTKTMRQLSRTEKQLLAIYAVFEQMERSGATGDLGRTLGSFANQSRIASENFKEILTYSGLIFTRWVQTTDLFQKLNGFLIFIGDVLEAAANTLPDIEVPNDPLADMAQNAEQVNNEIDEIQGKLLGFDKFRSLDTTGSSDEAMGLDQSLIDAFSKTGTIFDYIDDKSKQFADNLKIASGLFDEEGVFQADEWERLAESIGIVTTAIGIGLIGALVKANAKILLLMGRISLVALFLIGGIALLVSGIQELISGDIFKGLLLIAGAILLIGVAIAIVTGAWIPLVVAAIVAAVITAGAFIYKYWEEIKTFFINLWDIVANAFIVAWEAVSTWFMKLINTISNAFITFVNWCVDALNWLITPIDELVKFFGGKGLEIPKWEANVNWGGVGNFANGGLPDKGTMFVAGEAGAEMVYNMPSGQSGVANVDQIAEATYRGNMMFWQQARRDLKDFGSVTISADSKGIFKVVTGEAKRQGKTWASI